jgi:uncharacterized YigZ family protein
LDTYLSIAAPSIGEFKDKGSKFIAYAYFVQSEEDIKEKLDALKKEHFKATHHCYAYRLGTDGKKFRANDDGEPSGTAGKPILGQIDSFGMSNVFIVVVRYYGGTKLGTSGLIHAYREAAKIALQESVPVEIIVETILEFCIPYTLMNEVMQFVKQQEIMVLKNEYKESDVIIKISVRNNLLEIVNNKIESWTI